MYSWTEYHRDPCIALAEELLLLYVKDALDEDNVNASSLKRHNAPKRAKAMAEAFYAQYEEEDADAGND